ncbi:MAG: FHA domain-containing protein, partial [Planctomycetes bacterium]|nr:FHA domain-containing protein [Planctomycetota bacterium]
MHEQTAYAGPVLRCIRGSNLEGNLAVALGWMTQEQLREALVEQAHLSSAGIVPTLDGILLSGYLITEDQAATLSRLNHAAYAMQDVYRIGAIALRAGWIRRDQLRAALARHRETPGGEAAGFFAECAGLSEDGVRAACEVQSRIVREKERRGVSHAVAEMPLEERTSWRIGRAAGCEILIDDSEVSKVHARIFRRAGQWFVEDLGNRIGTLLDGRRLLGTAPFGRGSVIVVGSAVVCLAEPARPKAPAARYLREERRPSGEGEYRFAAATFLSIATAVSALVATWQEPPPPAAGRVGASTLAAPTPEPRREAAPAPAVAGTAPAGKDPVRETPRAEPAPAAEMPPAEGPAPEFPVAAATPPAAIPSPD